MKTVIVLICLSFHFTLLPAQTAETPVRGRRPVIRIDQVPESAFEKGRIYIKFKAAAEPALPAHPATDRDGIVRFNIPGIDVLNRLYRVSGSKRIFGKLLADRKYEARHNAWGLQRWYQLNLPANTDIRAVVKQYRKLSDLIEVAEPVYRIERYRGVPPGKESVNFVPNDLQFSNQWNYNNTGQQGGSPGSDIHLEQAWDINTGDSNVIVGVVDGGIQADHPDIAANMWYGKGFNFVTGDTALDQDEHGTHTAGTVAAVSNNGIGVSGIAGGDGNPGSGVRLMSLEIFGPSTTASNVGAAYIWAADHGAAISQNSWGYTQPDVYNQSVLDGIDYFIQNGGGTVLQGGLVIFAAGNNNSSGNYYPGYYDRVIAVAATNNSDVRSYYSNYGSYVDISAPGGEQSFTNDPHGILSTTYNSGYEYLQGTSMACPHVSGVAALIVSEAPGRLSADDVRSILLSTTDNNYPVNSSFYAGKLGTGRLNAYQALLETQGIAGSPVVDAPSNFSIQMACPDIQVSWTPNASNDEVMVAYSYNGNFGFPKGSYAAGDAIAGGGTVAYRGPGPSFNLPVPDDSAVISIKIWSVSASNDYSWGQVQKIRTPFSIVGFSGVEGSGNILLNWTKKCPFSDVLIASDSVSSFGTPGGNLQAGDNVPGGGRVIYKGSATDFIDNNPVWGTNYYRLWPVHNDSVYSSYAVNLSVCYGSLPGPVSEGFENSLFPPAGWQLINPDGGDTWERTGIAHKSGFSSATIAFYTYAGIGQQDYLLSPPVNSENADTILFSFDRAYRQYDDTYADTLEVVVSTDCGQHFIPVWKKGGLNLATVNGTLTTSAYVPNSGDWKSLILNLKPYIGNAKSFIAGFRSTNEFGQNLYLDNVNINVIRSANLDVQVQKIDRPLTRLCSSPLDPIVEIANLGKDTLSTLLIYYRLDQDPADSIRWNGQLLPGQADSVYFSEYGRSVSVSGIGHHIFQAYTSLPNGLADERSYNDTSVVGFALLAPVSDPVTQSFESPGFPDNGWTVSSSGHAYTWQRTQLAASDLSASAWIRDYRFDGQNRTDDLFSPIVRIGQPDSVYLSFNVAHATKYFPGSTTLPLDTLEVLLTTDCGNSFQSVYKKWGTTLTTVDPNFPLQYDAGDTVGFVPNASQWRKQWIDLTGWVTANSQFQFVFRNASNNGNNIFLDKVELSTVTLPARLKEKGYLISPSPFQNVFSIRHVTPPVHLKGIQVSNMLGQLVYQRSFSGNAPSNIYVDLSSESDGVYQLKMVYDNKVITERIIKKR